MIDFDFRFDPHHHGDVGIFSNLISLGTGDILDQCERNFDFVLFGEFFDLGFNRVGIVAEKSNTEERQAAYARDITYCTNKQLTFDYLKDRTVDFCEACRVEKG